MKRTGKKITAMAMTVCLASGAFTGAAGVQSHAAEPDKVIGIAVDTTAEKREIPNAMFGINHRYHNDGYSSWNTQENKIEEKFNEYVKEAAFGSIRYPGGTVANLYDWKRAIGTDRKKTIHGAGLDPVTPNLGVDEAMTWIYDDLGSEAIWVYGMGQGSAADAADLFEYLNAPNDGTNINGGVDWAAERAKNGHEEPYGVTRFEIGNEFGLWGQNYWMTGNLGEAYVNGGEFAYNMQNTVKDEDWRAPAANSDGSAGQVRYMRYDPVKEGSASVYVGSAQWTIVESLEGQGQKNVCTVDYETGKITFGDGVNGNIPGNGQAIKATYTTIQDGFTAYYDSLKDAAALLDMDVEVYSCMETPAAINALKTSGNKYDGAVIHPYSETSGNSYEGTADGYIKVDATDPEFYEKLLGRSLEHNMTRVQALKDRMGEGKVPVISEFGIYNHNTQFVRSIGHAVYIANEMIDYINFGTPYLNKHCLIDYPYGSDNLGSGSQCVIQAIKDHANGTVDFVSTPSAKAFSIFNHMTGDTEVSETISNNEVYYTYQRPGAADSYDVPAVKVLSTKDAEGNTYVSVVNNRKNDTTLTEISVDGRDLTDKEIEVWYLTSENADDENTVDAPNKVDVVKTTVTGDGESLAYTLAPHSITSFKIPADPVMAEISVKAEQGGTVSGGGKAEVGTNMTVTAQADSGYVFEGWYSGNVKVSDRAAYTFEVKESGVLTARFTRKQTETEKPDDNNGKEPPVTLDPQPEKPEKPAKLAAPKGLKAKKTSKGISLSWKKVKEAKGYLVYRSYKKNKGFQKIATIKKPGTVRFLDKKIRKGKTAYYRLCAYKGTKKSAYTKVVKKKN